MPELDKDSKPAEVETLSIDSARDVLGDIVARADYAGTPTIITRYGKEAAVVIGMAAFERLRSVDSGAAA